MARKVSLRPRSTDDETELPLAFEALDDITHGDVYTDESGQLISRAELTKRLHEQKTTKRVARVKLKYRLPSDPIESELRVTFVNVPVIGRMTSDELARVVNQAARNVYDVLRAKKNG